MIDLESIRELKDMSEEYQGILVAFIGLLFILPFMVNDYIIHLLIMSLLWGLVASQWNYIMTRGGIFSLAQIAFFAIGGYVSGILAKEFMVTPYIGMIVGGLGGAAVGAAIGALILRLRGMYVALFTIAFQQLFSIWIHNQAAGSITGGRQGLMFIPSIGISGISEILAQYYIILIIFLISCLALYLLESGFTTVALEAFRDDESLAFSRGLKPYFYKLKAFAISSFFIGVAGGFYAHYMMTVDPSLLDFSFMVPILAMMVVGGTTKFYGPVLGAFTITFLDNYFLEGLREFRLIVMAIILIAVLVLLPKGLLSVEKIADYFKSRFGD